MKTLKYGISFGLIFAVFGILIGISGVVHFVPQISLFSSVVLTGGLGFLLGLVSGLAYGAASRLKR